MARPPTFIRADALHAAMVVFWSEGFQGASMKTLGDAMGLKPGSIYAAFGSKEELFREALDAYVALVREKARRAKLSPRRTLERWFAEHIKQAQQGVASKGQVKSSTKVGRGCMLLNAAAELPAFDAESARAVRTQLDTLQRFFEGCIAAARRDEGATDKPSAKETARLLVAALGGISMLSRAGSSKAALQQVARAALRSV